MKKTKSNVAFLILIFILLLPFRSVAQPPQWVNDLYEVHTHYYNIKGIDNDLAYRLLPPINFDSDTKYPVIINLHGGTKFRNPRSPRYNIWTLDEDKNIALAGDSLRTKYPTYVIVPQAKEGDMWGRSHVIGLQEIIAALPSVDLNRIYVMGQSAGGRGTNNFIKIEPTYFAAAISASADPSDIEVERRESLVNFNLWIMIGELDTDMNRYAGTLSFFEDMKSNNAKMKLTIFTRHGHSTGDLMFGNYGAFSDQPVGRIKWGYKTEFAGTDSDPETDTLKWMFSKSNDQSLGLINNCLLEVNMYPNPTNSIINWSSNTNIDQVVVSDLHGKVIIKIIKPNINSIDISKLAKGMYFISLHDNDKATVTKRIIKK